ncbi:hypothetical protein B0T14DRAFT_511827 [Immersiella caudata]|uniref:Uncharacterized protein n=1 Tax=Immersiella caudata TaxID=314043 RepID=A0AA39X4G5_9PEZI|nr:hypothetical protein B0T14DRAFT_511827 [Immersiella caudata]
MRPGSDTTRAGRKATRETETHRQPPANESPLVGNPDDACCRPCRSAVQRSKTARHQPNSEPHTHRLVMMGLKSATSVIAEGNILRGRKKDENRGY